MIPRSIAPPLSPSYGDVIKTFIFNLILLRRCSVLITFVSRFSLSLIYVKKPGGTRLHVVKKNIERLFVLHVRDF